MYPFSVGSQENGAQIGWGIVKRRTRPHNGYIKQVPCSCHQIRQLIGTAIDELGKIYTVIRPCRPPYTRDKAEQRERERGERERLIQRKRGERLEGDTERGRDRDREKKRRDRRGGGRQRAGETEKVTEGGRIGERGGGRERGGRQRDTEKERRET